MNAYSERGPRTASRARALTLLLAVAGMAVSGLALPPFPGGAAPLAAQAPDTLRQDTVYIIEPIAVRAVRPSATTGGVSAVTVRLDSVRFRPAPLLEDVLRELPLVQVRTNSRGEAQLALRGAEERQIAVLLDGVPLTLGWDHRTDLSVVPMTAAQRVQLIRGMSSVLHGPNVLGGVVEIGIGSIPVVRTEPLQVAAGMDDQGGYSLSALGATRVALDEGSLVVRGGVGRRERDGLAAPGDPRSVYPALVGHDTRVNSDLEHTDGFFSARLSRPGLGWLSTTVSGFQADRGVPPELNQEGPRLWRYPEADRLVGIVAGGLDGLENGLGPADLSLNLGVDLGSTVIDDYAMPDAGAEDAADFFRTVMQREAADDRTLTLRLRGSQGVGGATVRGAATVAEVSHDERITQGVQTVAPDVQAGEYRQRLWSVGAEAELPFEIRGRFLSGGRLSAGLVLDGADTPETGPDVEGAGPSMSEWGGRLGVSASTRGGGILFHTAVSRRGRFPALRELYSTALGKWYPNPALQPEVLTAVEAGFTSRFGSYDLQVVGFHQRLDDAIVRGAAPAEAFLPRYPRDDQPDRMRVNRDQIRSTGLEVLAGYTVGRLALETEFTVQSVEVVEPDAPSVRAEYEPELAGGVGGTIPLIAGIEAGAEIEYWSEQFCSTPSPGQEEYETLDPSTRTDVQLGRTIRLGRTLASFQRVGVELAIDNLTDSLVYDQCGLPQPGRTFRLQIRLD